MTKRYSSAIKERTPRPRSKRLRDTTGGGVIGGGTSITGGSGESGGGGDGHSHANLYHLNRITTSGKYIEVDGEKAQVGLADEATHAVSADNAEEAAHAQNADEAQHALNADEAEHAINADEAEHAKNADEAERAKEADNAIRWYGHFWDDWMNQAVRTGDTVQFAGLNVTGDALVGGSVRSSVFRSGIMTGEGWKIGADGAGELESLVLRSFLEVPELRYNRVTVESGTSWNAPGAGKVLAVGSDERGDYLLLKLEEGEVGSFAKDDICMGVWHYTDETLKHFNATDEDAAADNNGLTVSGFATVYFYVTDHPEDYELDGVTYTNGKVRFAIRTTGSYSDNILKPMKAMAIVAYGNFTNESRQKSVYRTRTFTRFLMKQNTWDITYRNVAMQLGDVSGLSIPLKDGSFADLSGYSAYLNNVFFSGHIEELDIADLTDESGLLDAKNYSVELSCYVDEVTLGNDGAVIGGLWNEDTAEDGGVVRKYRFQTAVTARRNGELLLDNGREKPRTGFYRLTAVGKGCDCFVRNSTVYVSGIDGVKVDGELSDDEKERMLKLESCSVDLTVECEGGAVITKTYTITIKHSNAPTISENGYWIIEGVETEFSAVGDDGHAPKIVDGYWYEFDPDLNEGKGDYHPTGIKAKGENGLSAYEIYKKSGGNLSESGWLESLVGPKGLSAYEVYKKNGGSLSESAWLESLDGEPGLSAYDIYIANGGTLSEKGWLESLVGPKGLSAYEVYKKNGGTLSEVAWLESLDGEPGLSAYDIYIANGGTLSEKGWLESLKGNPGTKGALVRLCGEWNASVTYVNDDHFVDVVMYGGGYRKLADGKASDSGTSPSSSGDNSTWVVFSNFKALAASVLLANSGYVDVLGAGAMFIGVNSNGVTHNSDGSTSLSSTAKGWVITNGSIYYIENGKKGVELTADGYINDPNGLHLKVSGKAIDQTINDGFNQMDSAVTTAVATANTTKKDLDTTKTKLLETGIDIMEKVIRLTADNFYVLNNKGEQNMYLDEYGNLSINGWISQKVTTINSVDDLCNIGFPVNNTEMCILEDGEVTGTLAKNAVTLYANGAEVSKPSYPLLTASNSGLATRGIKEAIYKHWGNQAEYENHIAMDIAKMSGIISFDYQPVGSSATHVGDTFLWLPWISISSGEACGQIQIPSSSAMAVRLAPLGHKYNGAELFLTGDREVKKLPPYTGNFQHGSDASVTEGSRNNFPNNYALYFNIRVLNATNNGVIYSDRCLVYENKTGAMITLGTARICYRLGDAVSSTQCSASGATVTLTSGAKYLYAYILINGTYKTNEVIIGTYAGTGIEFLRTFTRFGNQKPHLVTYDEIVSCENNRVVIRNNTPTYMFVVYDSSDMDVNDYIRGYSLLPPGTSEEFVLTKELDESGSETQGGVTVELNNPRFSFKPQHKQAFDFNKTQFDEYKFGGDIYL